VFAVNNIDAAAIYEQGIAHLNVGTGTDEEIIAVARMIRDIVSFDGEIVFDETKPDGTFRKLLDVTRIHGLGWRHQIELREGLGQVYEWYLEHSPVNRESVPAG